MNYDWTLWGLFLSAFISSTLLPGGSEAVLAVLTANGGRSQLLLLFVATVGNTLGGMTSWGLGRFIAVRYGAEQVATQKYQRAIAQLQRFGHGALLFSWLPVIGDPLCVAAGWLRINVWKSVLFIGIGKALRYVAIVLLAS